MGLKLNLRGSRLTTEEVEAEPVPRPSAEEAIANSRRRNSINDEEVTGAGQITTRQSIIPVSLVTVLFFMWGFAYGLLDVLNKHFQETLHISAAESAGLQGAYFGAYFIGPLTYSGWVVRKFGYRRVKPLLYRNQYTNSSQMDIYYWSDYLWNRSPLVLAIRGKEKVCPSLYTCAWTKL